MNSITPMDVLIWAGTLFAASIAFAASMTVLGTVAYVLWVIRESIKDDRKS